SVGNRAKYLKRTDRAVTAVQFALDTDALTYRKWGGVQTCKPDDWIVDNDGDIYTVDRETFERTYRRVSPGRDVKVAPVWAEVAERAGIVETKEGVTRYQAGDYLVFNEEQGGDAYAVSAKKFEQMYERAT